MEIALAHDWLVDMAGAESVLAEMHRLYPEAPIYTLFAKNLRHTPFADARIIASPMQKLPAVEKLYRKLPNLFPWAVSRLYTDADLLLSSSHAAAKALPKASGTCHICYIHTPMRYVWDLAPQYLASLPFFLRPYARMVFRNLRHWDIKTSANVDFFIANSQYIRKRVQDAYGRDADVIYPPVHLAEAPVAHKENYYVTASRHVPYKKIPLIAEAFAAMPDKTLVVLGDGTDFAKVQGIAARAPNVICKGYLPRKEMFEEIGRAKAFVFAAEEDFGILPVEAQSLGTPVIAFKRGGACETVAEGKTGLFFEEQNAQAIREAVRAFEKIEDRFDPAAVAAHVQKFSAARFRKELSAAVEAKYQEFKLKK